MVAEIVMATALATAAIEAQEGPQRAFLSSTADIAITGGAAGGGKTWGLLVEPLRHRDNGKFGAVIFRRTYPNITNEGGLWDEANEIYPDLGGKPNQNELTFRWRSGMTVSFRHQQHAKDRHSWKGAQVPLFGFDQLEEFEEEQFWYLLSRSRSARSGVRPYVRGTCNPVPADDPVGGWLNKLLAWWIDQDTGYAIPERSGVIRWFVRVEGRELHWADSAAELAERFPGSAPKSLTFVPSKLSDNQVLERADPGYRGWLMSLPLVDRERLLMGNWKIKPEAGKVFNRAWFKSFLGAIPSDVIAWVRYWDKAGTEGAGKYTAGVLVGKRANGRVIIADVVRGRWSAGNREAVIKQTAVFDSVNPEIRTPVEIWVEQEPGSGGKESAENTVRNLGGFTVHAERVTGDKVTRAGPLSSQAEAGNVDIFTQPWNEALLSEMQNFDGEHGFTDQVDASSGAYNKLASVVAPQAAGTAADDASATYGPMRANYGRRGGRLIGGRG